MRLVLLILCAGCSGSSSPSPDLAAACGYVVSGDIVGAGGCTYDGLCHPTSNDYEDVSVLGGNFSSHFDVDGVYALRSYTAAELRSFEITYNGGAKKYAGNPQLAGSTMAVTINALIAPKDSPCDGVARGTATATLVEWDGSSVGSGRVTVALTF